MSKRAGPPPPADDRAQPVRAHTQRQPQQVTRPFGMDGCEMGRRIGYWRRRRNLTQAVFADRIGRRIPVVAMPFTNRAHAAHPAFIENIARLRSWGVVVLFGPDVYPLHEPGTGSHYLHLFPWARAAEAVGALALDAG